MNVKEMKSHKKVLLSSYGQNSNFRQSLSIMFNTRSIPESLEAIQSEQEIVEKKLIMQFEV